jgi:exodeoxyribonuclease VII small subunit
MSKGKGDPEEISFEDGYQELKELVDRLREDEVPIEELFDKFRRGKGLEKALRDYLSEKEGELEEIEQGKHLPEFNIVGSGSDPDSSPSKAKTKKKTQNKSDETSKEDKSTAAKEPEEKAVAEEAPEPLGEFEGSEEDGIPKVDDFRIPPPS